jgi:hypothetical protein
MISGIIRDRHPPYLPAPRSIPCPQNAMNNPFANFDLEASLSTLPGVMRQPMVLAVAASGLVHGLVFLVLPVVTNSAESKKLPDRIVNVIDLSPEQQAKLPPSMMVSQLPTLPTTMGGKLPLTGLLPGMLPNNPLKLTPTSPSAIDKLLNGFAEDSQNSIGSSQYFPPVQQPYNYSRPAPPNDPVVKPPEKTAEQKKEEETIAKKQKELETQKKIEADEPAKKQKAEEDKNKTGTGVTLPPGQTAPPPGTPTTPEGPKAEGPKAADLKPTAPASPTPEQQKLLVAARTFNPAGAAGEDYKGTVIGKFLPKVAETTGKTIPELFATYGQKGTQNFPDTPAPADWQLNFTNLPKDQKYITLIEAYVKADGSFAFDPQVTKSSGFGLADDQALKLLADYLKLKQPDLGKDKFLQFQFTFVQNAPA